MSEVPRQITASKLAKWLDSRQKGAAAMFVPRAPKLWKWTLKGTWTQGRRARAETLAFVTDLNKAELVQEMQRRGYPVTATEWPGTGELVTIWQQRGPNA